MAQEIVFGLLGGLGLFFFGMKTMSESLKRVASDRLKNTLDILTKHPVIGLFVGTTITALVQSSSATTVLTVGFVNAGLLSLKQAISIILGANIGTTLTAWLVSFFALFKITNYALPAIGIGFFLTFFGKTSRYKMWGQFILGFGLLFTGLGFMKDVFTPLKESGTLKSILVTFGRYPLLGILLGIGITMLLQSSSATIALLEIMAFSGLIDFNTCIPIILGDNIGTTITAQLASLGTNITARRAARAHALLNVIGVLYMFIPVYLGLYSMLIEKLIPGPITENNIMIHIALAHSTFNIVNSFFVFLPLINLLERLSVKLTRERGDSVDMQPIHLEKHLLETPGLALRQAENEIVRMVLLARDTLEKAIHSFFENDEKLFYKVNEQENAIDNLQTEITRYLVELSQKNMAKSEAETVPVLIHCVNDVERVGDHAMNILELAERKIRQKLPFTDDARIDLKQIVGVVSVMFEHTISALQKEDVEYARKTIEKEEEMNTLQVELKENHIQRVNNGSCVLLSGIVFIDFVDNIEKIGDHLTNIAQGVLRHLQWNGN